MSTRPPATRRRDQPMLTDFLLVPFDFLFMRRAIVGSLALAIGAGPLGVMLMLRRLALTGDVMAHAILPGVALGYLVAGLSLPAMALGGLAAGLVVTVLAGLVARWTASREDASLASFYLLSLALGVCLVSWRGSNTDLTRLLFGSVLALDTSALLLMASVASITLAGLAVLYRPLVLDCVDPQFLRVLAPRAGGPAQVAFLALVVLNLVGGFQAFGTLLAVGMMVLPATSARFWSNDITAMLFISAGLGVMASLGGLLLSYHSELPAGPAIILVAGAVYLVSLGFGPAGGLIRRVLPRRHLEA